MTLLATIRPDEWNLPLFLHVVGAFALVGALVVAATYLFAARRDGSVEFVRAGYRTLLWGAVPAFIVNRVGAQWILDKENLTDSEDAWITIGFLSTDVGILFLIGATAAAGLALRRAQGGRGLTIASWLVAALVAIYAIVIWVMATKPA